MNILLILQMSLIQWDCSKIIFSTK